MVQRSLELWPGEVGRGAERGAGVLGRGTAETAGTLCRSRSVQRRAATRKLAAELRAAGDAAAAAGQLAASPGRTRPQLARCADCRELLKLRSATPLGLAPSRPSRRVSAVSARLGASRSVSARLGASRPVSARCPPPAGPRLSPAVSASLLSRRLLLVRLLVRRIPA